MPETSDAILNRHARAIRILTCLQSGPGFNAAELAEYLGVSRRTIYRDLRLIRDAGVKVRFDTSHAAYRLAWDTQQVLLAQLNSQDLSQLALAAHTSAFTAPGSDTLSREALVKLLCLYPSDTRNRISRTLGSCFVHLPSSPWSGDVMQTTRLLLSAIGDQVCVRATVDDERGLRRTKLEPYRVDISPEAVAVTGRSSFDSERVTIEVDALRDVELTTIPYSRPSRARLLEPV